MRVLLGNGNYMREEPLWVRVAVGVSAVAALWFVIQAVWYFGRFI